MIDDGRCANLNPLHPKHTDELGQLKTHLTSSNNVRHYADVCRRQEKIWWERRGEERKGELRKGNKLQAKERKRNGRMRERERK